MQKESKPKKPGFFVWILHNPTAFKVLSMMSVFMGLLISILITIAAFVFDYNIFFKIMFSLMLVYQLMLTTRAWIAKDMMVNTVHNFTYKQDFQGKTINVPVKKEEKQ